MDWAHLFMPSGDSTGGNDDMMGSGPLDTEQPFVLPTSNDFFENFPASSASALLPPRPPSIPPDLEPAPLFSPKLDLNDISGEPSNTITTTTAQETLQKPQPQPPQRIDTDILPSTLNNLFDSKEESYLNSFLNSFDVEGLDLGSYLNSPPAAMAGISSQADFASIGMGMGIGAGMMGAMDDAIPHLSIDEFAQETSSNGLVHMAHRRHPPPSSAQSGTPGTRNQGRDNQNRGHPSTFDYGLGDSSHLSLSTIMSEEMQKVSSWLLQNQAHQSAVPPPPPLAIPSSALLGDQQQQSSSLQTGGVDSCAFSFPTFTSPPSSMSVGQQQQHFLSSSAVPHSANPASDRLFWNNNSPFDNLPQNPRPPSESDMSVKRKASFDQLEPPRKTRGSVFSPVRESFIGEAGSSQQGLGISAGLDIASSSLFSPPISSGRTANVSGKGKDKSTNAGGGSVKRRESKKSSGQRVVLTEEERRANHIASEQRRRNQIRQGYAELMNLVTTLRDPALGNHPGTAHSTPSKAVILAHAVQFIRGLEEGNRQLRKRLEGTNRLLPTPAMHHMNSQTLAAFRQQQQQNLHRPQ